MKYALEPRTENHAIRVIAVIAIAIILVAGIAVGIYGLFFADNNQTRGLESNPEPIPTAQTQTPQTQSSPTDPEQFAHWVTKELFTWDTTAVNRDDVVTTLMSTADPSGEGEASGLAADLDNYLPEQSTWVKLRGYSTKQSIQIESITVPETWDESLHQATSEQILPGTYAYTVTGVRHREGVWNEEPTTFQALVSFTMFITCAPSFPECHLMRLSMPDQPMK